MEPQDRSYLVIGASGTIGSAVARRLAGPSVRLGLHYFRNREKILLLQREFEKNGCETFALCADLMSEDQCTEMVRDFQRRSGAVHGLAICSGTVNWKDWRELESSDWHQTLMEHCVAPFMIARQVVPLMLERGTGRIAYLSSISPKYAGSAKSLHYAAAKSALETAMRGLAREVAESGIRINGIRSGFVLTPQQTAGRNAAEIEDRIRKIPVGRAGSPEDIASAFRFLLADASDFMTGDLITVSGGD